MQALYGDFTHGLRKRGGEIQARFTDPATGRSVERDGEKLHELWWDVFSYVPQGSMSVLNPLMRVEKQMVDGLPRREQGGGRDRRCARGSPASSPASGSTPACSTPTRTSSPAACASAC